MLNFPEIAKLLSISIVILGLLFCTSPLSTGDEIDLSPPLANQAARNHRTVSHDAGLLVLATAWDEATSDQRFDDALVIIADIRRLSPGFPRIPATVVSTSLSRTAPLEAVTVVRISSPSSSVELLRHSSYTHTVAMEATMTVCYDIGPLFAGLGSRAGFSLIVDRSALSFDGDAGGAGLGIFAFANGTSFAALLERWRLEVAETRYHPGPALVQLLRVGRLEPFRVGVSGSVIQAQFHRWASASKIVHSLLLRAPVITYPAVFRNDTKRAKLCEWINEAPDQPRMIIYNDTSRETKALRSRHEVCSALGSDGCSHFSLDWWAQPPSLQSAAAFLRLPSASSTPIPLAARHINNLTYGVIMFAYSQDRAARQKYVLTNVATAWGVKATNPGMPIALFINGHVGQGIAPFDRVVAMPDSVLLPGRQWWSRTMSLNATPWDLTIMIDSDRIVCGDLTPLFRLLLDWDMVGTSAGSGGGYPGQYDNGVLGYKRGPSFDALHRTWLAIQRRVDQAGDDQHTLSRAFREHPGYRAAIVSPAWQVKLFPARLAAQRKHKTADHDLTVYFSLVVHGDANVLASWTATEEGRRAACANLNKDSRPRIFVMDEAARSRLWGIAFNQSACDELTGGLCDHPEIDWNPPPMAVSFLEYVAKHRRRRRLKLKNRIDRLEIQR